MFLIFKKILFKNIEFQLKYMNFIFNPYILLYKQFIVSTIKNSKPNTLRGIID